MRLTIVFLALFYLQLCACSDSNDIDPGPNEPDEEIPQTVEQLVEVSDDADLQDLPSDVISTSYIKEESFKGANTSPYGYVMRRPEGFGNDGLKYPILIFLHGVGSRGNSANNPDDLKKVDQGAAIRAMKLGFWDPQVSIPVIAPQTANSWNPIDVQAFMEYLIETYPNSINPDRIYLGGFSMGGFGVWNYLDHFGYENSMVAAAVSLAGAPEEAVDVESLKFMPFWVFHGRRDPTVSVSRSTNLVSTFRNEYPNQDHQKLTVFTQDDVDGQFHRIDHGVYDRTSWDLNQEGDLFDVDVMNWMLLYKRGE